MITGQPFRIADIRANRPRPGLMRQHLVAVRAAAQVSRASVTGGDCHFAISSAGSCTLVLQTIVLALLYVEVDIELKRSGFYPAGGEEVFATARPCAQLKQISLMERGVHIAGHADAFVAGLAADVGLRELDCIGDAMGWEHTQLHMHRLPGEQGPGNAVLITLQYEHVTEVFAGFGAKAVRAEAVAQEAIDQAHAYIKCAAAAGEHLADQLLLPMALASGGSFTASTVSMQTMTNAEVIGRFLPVIINFEHGKRSNTCVVKSTCQAR